MEIPKPAVLRIAAVQCATPGSAVSCLRASPERFICKRRLAGGILLISDSTAFRNDRFGALRTVAMLVSNPASPRTFVAAGRRIWP